MNHKSVVSFASEILTDSDALDGSRARTAESGLCCWYRPNCLARTLLIALSKKGVRMLPSAEPPEPAGLATSCWRGFAAGAKATE